MKDQRTLVGMKINKICLSKSQQLFKKIKICRIIILNGCFLNFRIELAQIIEDFYELMKSYNY